MMRMKAFAFLVAVLLISAGTFHEGHAQAATKPAVLTKGTSNGDVWDLQFRLKTLGYYQTALDGQFGTQTLTAVRKFQKDYGLAPDGVVGPNTWKALKKVFAEPKRTGRYGQNY